MSEFVFWGSDMERFALCKSGSQIKPSPTLQGLIYGVGFTKGLFGTQICGLIFGGLISDGPFYVRNFTSAGTKSAFNVFVNAKTGD